MSGTILITGGSGFIGSYLVQQFLRFGKKVTGLSRQNNNLIQHPNCKWIQSDLTSSVPNLTDVDICIHTAAQSPKSGISTYDFVNNNIVATRNLLQALQKTRCKKIIFLSGVSVYGNVSVAEINEQTPVINPSSYGLSKLLAESILQEQSSIPVSILRLPGVLGNGSSAPWLVRQIRKSIKNEKISIYNANSFFNNAVWMSDLFNFIDQLIKMDYHTHDLFLLGAENKIPIRTIIELILNKTQSQSKIIQIEGRSSFTLDISKAIKSGYSSKAMKTILIKQIDCILAERENYATN